MEASGVEAVSDSGAGVGVDRYQLLDPGWFEGICEEEEVWVGHLKSKPQAGTWVGGRVYWGGPVCIDPFRGPYGWQVGTAEWPVSGMEREN